MYGLIGCNAGLDAVGPLADEIVWSESACIASVSELDDQLGTAVASN